MSISRHESLERDMSTAEDHAAVRIAIQLCHTNNLKKEILLAPGSEYARNISRYDTNRNRRIKWKEILENKTTARLENLGFRSVLIEKVTGLVISIGAKMLMWAKYHEGILDLSRAYCAKFLNSSFHTPHGIIDNKKAAALLMEDRNLSIRQKYTIACLYCFTEHIPDLFEQMSQEEKENLGKEIKYPGIVRFCSDFLMGEIDKLRGEKTLYQYMLEKAIGSGCKEAVEYCVKESSFSRKKGAVIEAALEAVRKTPQIDYDSSLFSEGFCYVQNGRLESIPDNYFVDILCFLLSKMCEEEMIEFLKKDIEDSQIFIHSYPRSRVLEHFLDWPYQNYFTKTAKLMWDFMPERTYAHLLFKICEKINPRVTDFKRGEEKSYDYQEILEEFWIQSPDHYKRFVFRDRESVCLNRGGEVLNEGERLLIVKLLTLNTCIYEDRKVVQLVWDSATNEEKESIICSKEWKDIFFALMEGQKWEILDECLSEYISSEQLERFKRWLFFSAEAQHIFAHFIKCNLEAAEFFPKWSGLHEEEIIWFKKEFICSEEGRNACWDLFLRKGGGFADRFCELCFSSEEDIVCFKNALIFSLGPGRCADLIMKDKLEVVDEFMKWSHLSHDDVREFKNHLQYEKGNYICTTLISGHESRRVHFQGGKWELVEKFLTWCFSSEEEIADFKRDRLLKLSGTEIHFRLIQSNQWDEAENFFSWLALSAREIKQLKKETFFNHQETYLMFLSLVRVRKANVFFPDYGIREEAIELLLRWFLTDKETVQEFRDHFNQKYDWLQTNEEDWFALKDFDSAIEQRLRDLDEEQGGTKRKFELSKDIFNVTKISRTAEMTNGCF